jgi:putative nucleotidyltransferase with HDIG domain
VTEAAVLMRGFKGAAEWRLRFFSQLSHAAWIYWLAVVGLAGGGLLTGAQGLADAHGWGRFALLATVASAAQLSSVQLTRKRVFHPAIVFVVAGALLLSPEQVALMCVVQHIPEWLKQRYPWYIQTFNIGNYVLAGGGAALASHAVHVGGPLGSREALAGIVAVTVFVVVNRALLAVMLRLGRQLTARASGLFTVDDLALEFVLAAMAVPFVVLWDRSYALAFIALAPLALIHFTQRAAHHLELASETISEQNDRLVETSQVVIERSTAALEALSATVDARDTYTAGHSRRVRELAFAIGKELDLSPDELETLNQAALLHDIGKIAVPDAVLLKHGPLDAGEWLLMRAHPQEGARIIQKLGYLEDVVPAIRHHHERVDGQGYPDGLSNDAIPMAARIIHVADALDAMTTRRVYREAMSLEQALEELHRGRGTDFCSRCVDALDAALESGSLKHGAPVERRGVELAPARRLG